MNTLKKHITLIAGFCLLLAILFSGCKKNKEQEGQPTVTTNAITNVGDVFATGMGTVVLEGTSKIFAVGICWSTSPSPVYNGSHSERYTDSVGDFSCSITGLTASTKYYARAYAMSGSGVGYGKEIAFTTGNLSTSTLLTPSDKYVFKIDSVVKLSWTACSTPEKDVITYDVYLGKSQTPELIASNLNTNDYLPQLENNVTYYWKIVAKDGHNNATTSSMWSFTNARNFAPTIPANPVPSDGATGTISVSLSWAACTDPDNDPLFYDVYLDTIPAPRNISKKITENSFTPGLLLPNKKYYWKIVVTDNHNVRESPVWSFTTGAIKYVCKDYDGYSYKTVFIGRQLWMAENLKTTHYNNGDIIGTTIPATKNISAETTPKYQWPPDGQESNVTVLGRLYTWYAITDTRNVCPVGFHVPSDDEWAALADYLGGVAVAGGKLKEIGTSLWVSPNTGATNETGFSGLPAGYRYSDNSFFTIKYFGVFWSSSYSNDAAGAFTRWLDNNDTKFSKGHDNGMLGYSVRCVKD